MKAVPSRPGSPAMSDLSYLHPRIELLAASPRREMLADRLRRLEMRPVSAETPVCFETPQPLLVDLPSVTPQQASQLKRAWLAGLSAPLILLRPNDHGLLRSRDAILLSDEEALDTLPARLQLRRRQAIRRHETEIRQAVSARFGVSRADDPGDRVTGSVLHIAGVSAGFLPLKRAMARRGLNLRSALSAATARSHLEQEAFSACLVEYAPDEPGQAFLDTLADGAPCDLPLILLHKHGHLPENDSADEIISSDLPAEVIASTVEELLRLPRLNTRETQIRLSSRTHDPETGLYNMDFLRSCLVEQIAAADAREEALSLLHIRLRSAGDADAAASRAMPALADFLARNLRMADLAARIAPGSIVVSLRDTPHSGALSLARRLVASLGGENIGAPGTPLPFGGSLSWRVVERRAYHTADTLIQSALAGPYTPASAA
ncbi:MAG: hypothetical protein GVY06_04155 [Alphaproteobacteria bacterium]|nr:hypothetical protein [Alphaproteobacteria bacterium]